MKYLSALLLFLLPISASSDPRTSLSRFSIPAGYESFSWPWEKDDIVHDFDVEFIQPADVHPKVHQFDKVEIGFALPEALAAKVNEFLTNGSGGINPFDPDQVSVEAEFSSGDQHFTVYGFYYEEFTRDASTIVPFDENGRFTPAKWINSSTALNWRIRFAPPVMGEWNCTIGIRVNNAPAYSYSVNDLSFTCDRSFNKGFLEKGKDNWHLKYSGTGESFFALGQDIAWPDAEYGTGVPFFRGGAAHLESDTSYHKLIAGGYMDVLDWISDLADNGGNMIRVVNIPSSYEFEFEKLNNYSNRMPRAWELDQLFDLCEKRNIEVEYCIDHGVYAGGTPPLNWDLNPYHTQLKGIDHPDDFLRDSTATKIYKHKLRYFASRWGYSRSLGVFELASEVSLWNYASGEFKRKEQQLQKDWHSQMIKYLRSLLPFRNILVASSYGDKPYKFGTNVFDLDDVDITTYHPYHNERNANLMRFDEMNSTVTAKGMHTLWPNKPSIFEETGTTNGRGDHGIDAGDMNGCDDISYHNILWSAAFMGGYGTGFNWWQWNNNEFRRANFPALKTFFGDVDFESVSYTHPAFWDDASSFDADHSGSHIETFYIRDNTSTHVLGWIHNCTYWWGNMTAQCTDRHGNHAEMYSGYNDDAYTDKPLPLSQFHISSAEVHHLNNGQDYDIDYYLTRGNGGIFKTVKAHSNIFGNMKIAWIDEDKSTTIADFAFKAQRFESGTPVSCILPMDSLYTWQDTVEVHGNSSSDVNGTFHYHWNFGNGVVSDARDTMISYDQPGTYLVTLIITDDKGSTETIQQYIFKPGQPPEFFRNSEVLSILSPSSCSAFRF